MKILIIRRDNIGDLICTTPLITHLRKNHPNARIDALVNSYNSPVLTHNPELNNLYVYTKSKHRGLNSTLVSNYLNRIKLIFKLRSHQYDVVILAQASFSIYPFRLGAWINPKNIIGYAPITGQSPKKLKNALKPVIDQNIHEVIRVLSLSGSITKEIDFYTPLTLIPNHQVKSQYQKKVSSKATIIGLHISARKIDQRWPAEHFIKLVNLLKVHHTYQFILFWSPGSENNKHHPGDDQKAKFILDSLPDAPIIACPTHELEELIAAIDVCDSVICSDGGAMHVAAGLGKPIVCFFGSSNPKQWHPWGVPHVVLQPESRQVSDIQPQEVITALNALATHPKP